MIPSTGEAEVGGSLEFKFSLVYKMSSRAVTQRNPVFKNKKKQTTRILIMKFQTLVIEEVSDRAL